MLKLPQLPKLTEKRIIILIFIFSVIFYSYTIVSRWNSPVFSDEGFYSLLTIDFAKNPAMIIPQLAGVAVEWKPPFFVWIYSFFYGLLSHLTVPQECALRLPSALFGGLANVFVFLVARKFYDKRVAGLAAIIFAINPLAVFAATHILIEILAVFLGFAAIYYYLDEQKWVGAGFLFLLTISKWLYTGAPVLFIILLYLERKKFNELKKIIPTLIVIPIALLFYLFLSAKFGDIGNAFLNLSMDVHRPIPILDLNVIGYNYFAFLVSGFPLVFIFPFLVLATKKLENKTLLFCGAIAYLMPLSKIFAFWYVILLVPFLAIISAKILYEEIWKQTHKVRNAVICVLLIICFAISLVDLGLSSDPNAYDAAFFAKNKSITFLELTPAISAWYAINNLYLNTSKNYLLLEETDPGFLFYRFNDSSDYSDLHVQFYRYEPLYLPCAGYLIIHKDVFKHVGDLANYPSINFTPPTCYHLINDTKTHSIYIGNLFMTVEAHE